MTGGGHVTGVERVVRPNSPVRLFVALELPPLVRDALATWRAQATEGIPGLRGLSGDQLHVTLCFLGWQLATEVDGVSGACRLDRATEPPELSLGEALWLPPRRPRVLAVRLSDADGRLTALQSELSERLHAGGWYEPERRPYLPHVTLARAGRQTRVRAVPLPGTPPVSFTGERITLFRSRLGPAGARYEPLSRMSLKPPRG